MKRASTFRVLVVALFVTLLLVVGPVLCSEAEARDKSLTFSWEQTLDPTLLGWKLYAKEGTTGGGVLSDYVQIGTILYDGMEKPEYESTELILAADGQETLFFFVVTAYDEDNESAASNEVSGLIDFLAPGTPVKFKIKTSN